MRYIGVDLSKRKFTAAFLDEHGRIIRRKTFAMDGAGLAEFRAELYPDDELAFESGTNCYYFYDSMKDHVGAVHVVNTYAFRVIKSSIKKNDENDAFLLAKFLRYGELPEIHVPAKIYRTLRELIGFRDKLVQTRTKMRNIVTTTMQREGILIGRKELDNQKHRGLLTGMEMSDASRMRVEITLEHIDRLERDIARVENELKTIVYSDPETKTTACRLMQIPCIGELTAVILTAEIGGNIERFSTKKQIASYAGMVNKTEQSGESVRHRQTKRGRPILKKTLINVVLGMVGRYDNPIIDFYTCKKKDKCVGKAVMAAARKLITVIYIMLKYNQDYRHVERDLYLRKLKRIGIINAA